MSGKLQALASHEAKIEIYNAKVKAERKLIAQNCGLSVTCPNCKERFTFRGSNLDLCHNLSLEDKLEDSCPMCRLTPQQSMAVRHELLLFPVQVLGVEVNLLRIPLGYRSKKLKTVEIVDGL
jgi:hypothetical protein